MERSASEIEAANARLMIINSFLVASTTILLTLNVSIIKGSIAGFATPIDWLLAASIPVVLLASLMMLMLSAVILVSMYLASFSNTEKMRIIAMSRTFLGLSSILILASFGSTFLVSLGPNTTGGLLFGSIGYGSAIIWTIARGYFLTRFVHSRSKLETSKQAPNA